VPDHDLTVGFDLDTTLAAPHAHGAHAVLPDPLSFPDRLADQHLIV
jgi:hypothetical protein